jgi:hypothetical protein
LVVEATEALEATDVAPVGVPPATAA